MNDISVAGPTDIGDLYLQLLTPGTSRSTRDEAPTAVLADTFRASLGAPVSGQGEQAVSTVKRAFSTASALLQIQRHGPAQHP